MIVVVGVVATLVALQVQSVYALWFLCSDLVYCLLFPQLLTALFDPRANRVGSVAGLAVSLTIRLACGEPTLGLPPLLTLPLSALDGWVVVPFRTLTMLIGLATIVGVSRLTYTADPPRALRTESLGWRGVVRWSSRVGNRHRSRR